MVSRTAIAIIAGILLPVALAGEPGDLSDSPESQAAAPPAHLRWLDDVRAQRKAWEAHIKTMKEAADARHRQVDPWGAAQDEAMEREAQAHRDAMKSRAERHRKAMESRREAHQEELDRMYRERERMWRQYTPYGWDNRWYYRGY